MKKIHYELRNLMNVVIRFIHQASDQEALSMSHAAIIKYLIKNQDKEIYIKDIQDTFIMRKSTCSRMLSLMEKKDLIKRIENPIDTRKKMIQLTDKGIQIHSLIASKFDAMDQRMAQNISPSDLEVFYKVLEQIKTNMTDDKEVDKND